MYYKVEKIIQEKHSERYKLSLSKKVWITLYLVGAIPIIINCSAFSSPSKIDLVWWIFLGLGSILIALSAFMLVKQKKATQIDNSKHISEVTNEIIFIELNSKIKITSLQDEIRNSLIQDDKKTNHLANIVAKVFLFIFWTPTGVLLSIWISNNPNELSNFSDVILIVSLLLQCAIMTIGIVMVFFHVVGRFIFQPFRWKKERVLRYLDDILYFDNGKLL
jgi:Flp pilus assembly protein TadB